MTSGATCYGMNHPLVLVSEGYALCTDGDVWWAWCLGRANQDEHFVRGLYTRWWPGAIRGRDGERIPAFFSGLFATKDGALAFIAADIEAGRRRATGDWDEESEQARLVEVTR